MRREVGDVVPSVAPSGESEYRRVAVLAIGDTDEWLRRRRPVPPGGRIILAGFNDLTQDFLRQVNPQLVLSPLLARHFDCIDLAQLLFALGFAGQYRVYATDIPNPEIILQEIRAVCPGLDFGILDSF